MRVNTYALLRDKIEEGIQGGLAKCEKRGYLSLASLPRASAEEAAVNEIRTYIINSICEYFDWEDEMNADHK